jgi:LCP family protein required for cell wall assembly
VSPPDDPPEYRVYRSPSAAPRPPRGARPASGEPAPAGGDGAPEYTLYRSRPRGLRARLRGAQGLDELHRGEPERGRPPGARRPLTVGRVVLWLAFVLAAWLVLSLVLFLVSSQIERSKVPASARAALHGGGFPLTSANTILVLGSDQRPKGSKEPGANRGPSRSDSIMLVRAGGGASARLSIPRDTVVDIPGHGRQKINAAYAFGGAALAVRTVESYLGIQVNHLVIVDFTHFPELVDALGGIDVKTGCVIADINGGTRNGGMSLRLRPGTHHLDGKHALALARVRKNRCNPAENDITRALRQQEILNAMKSRLASPATFLRLPWVAWDAPKTLRTDMGGVSMLGLLGALATSGSPPTRVLRPSGTVTLPDGEQGLTVDAATRQAAVRRFLRG